VPAEPQVSSRTGNEEQHGNVRRAPGHRRRRKPFNDILTTVAALDEDEELVVLAPFDPVPLEGVPHQPFRRAASTWRPDARPPR
jgi:hypothetical protein